MHKHYDWRSQLRWLPANRLSRPTLTNLKQEHSHYNIKLCSLTSKYVCIKYRNYNIMSCQPFQQICKIWKYNFVPGYRSKLYLKKNTRKGSFNPFFICKVFYTALFCNFEQLNDPIIWLCLWKPSLSWVTLI